MFSLDKKEVKYQSLSIAYRQKAKSIKIFFIFEELKFC